MLQQPEVMEVLVEAVEAVHWPEALGPLVKATLEVLVLPTLIHTVTVAVVVLEVSVLPEQMVQTLV
tara:strand:+ start:356 stop:553 length:198 start_codon:yes stop_codon:yes gene_type:complete